MALLRPAPAVEADDEGLRCDEVIDDFSLSDDLHFLGDVRELVREPEASRGM